MCTNLFHLLATQRGRQHSSCHFTEMQGDRLKDHHQEKGPGSDPGYLSPRSLFFFSFFYDFFDRDHLLKVLIDYVAMWLLLYVHAVALRAVRS